MLATSLSCAWGIHQPYHHSLHPMSLLPPWRAQVAVLQEQLQQAQHSIAARDGEVLRLGARFGAGGLDVDSLARDQRGDAYDTIILSLNKQVGGPEARASACAPVCVRVGLLFAEGV